MKRIIIFIVILILVCLNVYSYDSSYYFNNGKIGVQVIYNNCDGNPDLNYTDYDILLTLDNMTECTALYNYCHVEIYDDYQVLWYYNESFLGTPYIDDTSSYDMYSPNNFEDYYVLEVLDENYSYITDTGIQYIDLCVNITTTTTTTTSSTTTLYHNGVSINSVNLSYGYNLLTVCLNDTYSLNEITMLNINSIYCWNNGLYDWNITLNPNLIKYYTCGIFECTCISISGNFNEAYWFAGDWDKFCSIYFGDGVTYEEVYALIGTNQSNTYRYNYSDYINLDICSTTTTTTTSITTTTLNYTLGCRGDYIWTNGDNPCGWKSNEEDCLDTYIIADDGTYQCSWNSVCSRGNDCIFPQCNSFINGLNCLEDTCFLSEIGNNSILTSTYMGYDVTAITYYLQGHSGIPEHIQSCFQEEEPYYESCIINPSYFYDSIIITDFIMDEEIQESLTCGYILGYMVPDCNGTLLDENNDQSCSEDYTNEMYESGINMYENYYDENLGTVFYYQCTCTEGCYGDYRCNVYNAINYTIPVFGISPANYTVNYTLDNNNSIANATGKSIEDTSEFAFAMLNLLTLIAFITLFMAFVGYRMPRWR